MFVRKSMRLLKFLLFLFALVIMGDKSFSLTDYKIKKICRNEKRESACIKNLKEKRTNLNKGKFIEIPVIPYKNKKF